MRTELTNKEMSLIATLTSKLKVDEVFDVINTNSFWDYDEDNYMTLKDGFKLLSEAIAYPLEHEGFSPDDAQLIVNLIHEFTEIPMSELGWMITTEEEKLEDNTRDIAIRIMDMFEELLDSKDITVPCEDQTEEEERKTSDAGARLYGMEYWNLQDAVQQIIKDGIKEV